MGFGTKQILTAIEKLLISELPDGFPLIFPGVTKETSGLSEWISLSIPRLTERRRRGNGPRSWSLSVQVMIYRRPGTDAGRVHDLLELVRGALSGETILVHDYDQSGVPLTGYLRMLEGDVKENTRVSSGPKGSGLTEQQITISGIAREIRA